MNDLLYVLMGIDGNYITRACYSHDNTASELDLDSIKYDLDPTMDPSIAELVGRILPLPKYLQLIEEFIETHSKFKYGRAQHALAATMRDLMKLETQAMSAPHFGLQKLWFYLHPSLNTMAALYSLIDAVNTAERKAESTHAIAESMGPEFPAGTHQEQAASISQSRGFTRGGGLVLSVLCERLLSFSGDPVLKALYAQLLSSSAVPYNAMLSTWIHSGEIFDPYDEFMVVETRGLNKDQFAGAYNDVYWEHRYTLRREYVPSFLAILQDKVLLAGKYLNVVRECGVQIPEPHIRYVDYRVNNQTLQQAAMSDVLVAMGGERFVEDIETAYGYANRTLLALLFKDYHLMERLRSLKHYFLLDQSDFLVHFLDVAHEHLLKPARDVGVEQVKSLLELILRDPAASPGTNTYKEDIEAELSSKHFVPYLMRTLQRRRELGGQPPGQNVNDVEFSDQDSSSNQILNPSPETTLDGIEAFQLRYTAPFPTSLIINQKVLMKYQLTFRHLFQCKYIERQLADAWRDQAKSGLYNRSRRFLPKKTSHLFPEQSKNDEHAAQEEKESIFMSRICALRTKMLHFMQQYMYHVGYEVVEQLWEKFEEELLKADTIEHVIQIHYEFQDRCMKECMLSNVDMVKAFRKLMLTCTDFCRFSNSYTRFKSPYTSANDNTTRGSVPASLGHSSHPSALPEQVSDEYIAASGGAILTTEQAARKLKDLETSFLRQMRVLIDILKYYGATEAALFASLAARLDYNHFYARLPPDLSIVVRAPVDPTAQY
ncbi:hypothetical protein PhCBS80983_g02145 [Powellomyces hirtus]|uniref:Spindle pole body component n=1 Tax=Powellomyces hirtus TaxID=109895 RepID=A0A507E7T7_9FUNG|nr:hypothetical protein PhCBS80983_g02145 [Powellomyces hirtus]